MFDEIETAITGLGMTVCDSLTIPGRRTSRAKLPDAFVSGRAGDIPAKLFPERDGRLYKHQSKVLGHLCAGRNVVVSTGTASGKSLIFQLYAMRRLLEDKNGRVLALYPQIALRTDQRNKWLEIVKLAGNRNLRQKDVVMISSDMSRKDRETAMSQDPRILLMTPDMLHAWFMWLIDQEPHKRFLNGLSLLVLDEAHVYESVFGSNVGFLIRRLTAAKRMAAPRAKDAGKIQVVAATATIADPAEHMKRLTGLDGFRVVDEKLDGAPQKEKRVIHVEGSGKRARDETDVAQTLAAICSVEKKTKFIAFIDSRQGAEGIAMRTNAILGLDENAVRAYRSGLEDKDRCEIEKALGDGTLRGVVSTSALELGIDLPDVNIGLNLGVPRTRKSFRQRLGRIGRGAPGMFIVVAPRSAFAQIGDTLADYYEGSVEPSHIYLGNRFIQFAHARCLRLEVERLGGRNPRKPPAGVKWPEGFANALNIAREGWPSEYDEVARIGGGSPHINYGLRQMAEDSYQLEERQWNRKKRRNVGSIPLQSAIREAYPGADGYMHNGKAYWVDSWRSGLIAIRRNQRKRLPTRRPDLRKTVEADVSREGIIEGRLKRGAAGGFIAEAAIRVKESVEGYLVGSERYSYTNLHVNDPNMERKERVFSTTGVIIKIDADWFRDARKTIADGIREMLSRDRSLAPQDVDHAHSRIRVKTDMETNGAAVADAIIIYDAVYGGFRLTENLFDDFERYLDKLVIGADKSGEDALLSRELAVRLRDWAKTLVADSSGAGVEFSNANIPEGWRQAYKPGTIAEISHFGARIELELIEPILVDPAGTGVQLYYICRMNGGAKEVFPSAVVAPIGNEWEWTLWNPETGEYREMDA